MPQITFVPVYMLLYPSIHLVIHHAILSTTSVPSASPSKAIKPLVSSLFFHFLLSYLARIIVIRKTSPVLDSCSLLAFDMAVHVHRPKAQLSI